jgi:hypothetical protein
MNQRNSVVASPGQTNILCDSGMATRTDAPVPPSLYSWRATLKIGFSMNDRTEKTNLSLCFARKGPGKSNFQGSLNILFSFFKMFIFFFHIVIDNRENDVYTG